MTRQNRTLSILLLLALLVASLPLGANWALPARAQDSAEPGDQLPEFPAELVLGDQYFHYDRAERRDTGGLFEVGSQGDIVILAESDAPPYDHVFAAVPTSEGERLARYLAEIPLGPEGQPDAANPCRAEPLEFGELDTGNGVYVYAGADDVSLDGLATVATTGDGLSILGDPQAQPQAELFLDTGDGLRRFVLLVDGLPDLLGHPLQFQGTNHLFEEEATDTIDPGALTPVGCVGPFRVSTLPAEQSEDGVARLVVTVGDQVFAYRAAEAEAAVASPEGEEATPPEDASPVLEETPVAEGEEPAATADDAAAVTELGDAPLEVTVDGALYALDRPVTVSLEGLQPLGDAGGQPVYVVGEPPYPRVYRALGDTPEAGRYLPELPLGSSGEPSPDNPCLAETVNFNIVDLGNALYVFAGPEPDLTPDTLLEVLQTSDGQPVYAEESAEPFRELFFPSDAGLDRFVLLAETGLPITVGQVIGFAGQSFGFEGEITGEVDVNALVRVGCVGPFSVRAGTPAGDGGFDRVFVVLNDQTPRVFAFAAQAPAGEEISTTEPAEAPTIAPPTETAAAPTPTAIPPTATPLPPTATPVPPTETPPPTATPLPPTATPVPPTETPLPVATAEPPVVTPAPVATETDGTPVAVVETPASPIPPATDQVAPPEVFPTVPPPVTPVSAVPADAPPPVPAGWPREIEVQGVRYTFDLEVGVDPGTLEQVDVVQAPDITLDIFASAEDQASGASADTTQSTLAGPFARVYAVSPETGGVARYLSEVPVTPDGQFDVAAPCTAEANPGTFSHTFDGQQYTYTFAGVEPTLSVEALRAATTEAFGDIPRTESGREILVRAAGYPGVAEVFIPEGDTLERYIALNAAGLPVTLGELVFAETQFGFDAQVDIAVENAGLQRVGCAGPFPLFAPAPEAEATAPLITALTVVDNRVYQFTAVTTVIAPAGQTPPPPAIVPPPPGFVQITLQTTVNVGVLPTPLPNVRVIQIQPQPGATSTPTSTTGLVAQAPGQDRRCQGEPGEIGPDGLPERLPGRIQLSGIAYRFAGQEQVDNDVTLTRLGCVGPFEAVQAAGSGVAQVVFLRPNRRADDLYRYEAESSFAIDFTVSGDARAITANNQRYLLNERWTRSIYSSVTVIVYTTEADAPDPARLFAVRVDGDVIAEYVAEGGDVVEAPEELRARAEEIGINPDLVLGGGRRYLLVSLWTPIGTTTDGWVSLYANTQEGVPDVLLATDPRSLDLLIYRRSGT